MNKQNKHSLCYFIAPPGNLGVPVIWQAWEGIFWGVIFGSGIFLGIMPEDLGIFLGPEFCLHSIIPVIYKLEYPLGSTA